MALCDAELRIGGVGVRSDLGFHTPNPSVTNVSSAGRGFKHDDGPLIESADSRYKRQLTLVARLLVVFFKSV